MAKPRVAIFDFACCEGCQLQIVNLEEEILDLLSIIEPVEWREAMSEQSEEYDIAIIEGSIPRPEDEERLKKIRERAKVLIALGACATIGGVNKLKNNFGLEEARRCVYGKDAGLPQIQASGQVKSVGEVVKVDLNVQGCPINVDEFTYAVRCLAMGAAPVTPSYPVCVECKMRENVCRYELGEICLGPITLAGCNAPCPSGGFWCYGCRGAVPDPNVNAAKDVMEQYHKTVDDLMQKMLLFNSKQEITNA
jgi:coenzyme F420-reducing hydrogenase gamma subunit